MKRLVLLLVMPFAIWAQPEFFGYFESEADVMQLGSEQYTFGYHKFRLGVEARPSDNVLIGANINVQQYWGQTTWNLLDFLPRHLWMSIFNPDPLSCTIILPAEIPITLADTLFLDNFYARISLAGLDLTLGKQQLSPGVGYAWNPTDIFNTKTLLDPSYEQTGVLSIRADLPLDGRSTLSAVIQPEHGWENTLRQFWLKSGAGHFDFEGTVAQFKYQTLHSVSVGNDNGDSRTLIGGSVVGELLGWGAWTELAYNTLDDDGLIESQANLIPIAEPFTELVFGLDHTFDNGLYLLSEYFYNDYAASAKEELTYFDYMASLGGESHSLMQDYGFLYIMHPTFDYVTLEALAIANFNDNSGIFAPQLDWNVFEDTNISLQGSLSWGDDDTEFGLQDWGLRLRLVSNF